MINQEELIKMASARFEAHKQLFGKLSKADRRSVDRAFHNAHSEVFAETDCLACAYCCKTLGPRITDMDIRRISKRLRLKPSQFTAIYLKTDDDGDFVFKSMPCPFLDADNYCRIYTDRPVACREYPHTDRSRIYQILDVTMKNIPVCPAVYCIVEKLKQQFG